MNVQEKPVDEMQSYNTVTRPPRETGRYGYEAQSTGRYVEIELSEMAFLVLHGRSALRHEHQQQSTDSTLKVGTYLLLKMLSVPV